MSDTPRTDAAMEQVIANGDILHGGYMPLWVTSRTLERELAEANRRLQITRNWMLDDDPPHVLWIAFTTAVPEAPSWFDEDGVPK